MQFHRPTRGVVRLEEMRFDATKLGADVRRFEESETWKKMGYGDDWGKIELLKDSTRHPLLDECSAILEVIDSFDARPLDACLARLGPGGRVKEHRDISGGVPMGVARFHIPIVTHPDVQFFVNGKKLFLAPGEVWNLDTSYRHKLNNASEVWRVHLIVDVELNKNIKAILPRNDIFDYMHRGYFCVLCCGKALQWAFRPRHLASRVMAALRLRVLKKSSL